MALQDFDLPTEPLYRRNNPEVRRTRPAVDKGTLWAGAIFAAVLAMFMIYMLMIGQSS